MNATLDTATTKYARLAEDLRQRILNGDLRPGDQLPSFSKFRSQQGVTLTTIEKALSILERDGLIERFHGKGVFVAQKSSATRCLGFINCKQGTSAWGLYWVPFMEGLQAGAHGAGYNVLLINPALTHSWQDKVDGIIVHEMTPEEYAQIRLPSARVNVLSSIPGLTSVVADEYGGAYQAVRYLLDIGHRRIAYLFDDSHWATQMRLTGYRKALREAQVQILPNWMRVFKDRSQGRLWTQWGKMQMMEWLANDWHETKCTAMLCHNDEVAMGVMEALHEHGLLIPRDVSLIGYDGTILCETTQPKLTSVRVPLHEIGMRAATLLIEQIETGRTEVATLALPTTLQLRGSTNRLAITTA